MANPFKTVPTLNLRPDPLWLKPAPTTEEELERRIAEASKVDIGFNELKLLSPVDAQRFVNYLGSRWRTLGSHWYTRDYSDPAARRVFEREAGIEVVCIFWWYLLCIL